MTDSTTVVYIAGVARSGTSWIGQVFNSIPCVTYRFQPFFSYEFKDRLTEQSSAQDFRAVFAELRVANTPFLTQSDKVENGQYPTFAKDKQQTVLVFKENRYQYLVPQVLRKVPESGVVAVVRNPCAVLASWRKNPREFPEGSDFSQEWRHGMCKNSGPQDCFGYFRWKETANMYLDLKAQHPGRVFLLRYEEAVANPVAVFESLFNFFSLPFSPSTEQFIRESTEGHSDDYYSVFKNHQVAQAWKREMEPSIIDEIHADLKNTRLERFLER